MLRPLACTAAAVAAVGLSACGSDDAADPAPTPAASPSAPPTTAAAATTADAQAPKAATAKASGDGRKTIATGLKVPWGVAFLPDGDGLVSERTTGRILRIPAGGGAPKTAMTVPGVATDMGEGGLLGLAVSPDYVTDKLVYAYYTTSGDNRVARFKLGGKPQVILSGLNNATIHNGGRIAFGPDGKLYAGVGDAGQSSNAQDTKSMNGKILRMNPDGTRPDDNPFANLVWSFGHRNPQGLTWDKAGRMWAVEFGQDTYDEVNLIQPGKNYGWPNVEGKDSGGGKYVVPKVIWKTSDASPSGVAYASSALYVGALRGERVWKIKLNGASTSAPTKLFDQKYGRIRTVQAAPGNRLWLTTSNQDGRGTPRTGDDRIVSFRP